MTEPRMVKACPSCDSIKIRRWPRTNVYQCRVCHAVFDQPVERPARRDALTVISAESRERYYAQEASRKAREARYRGTRPARMAARWERKIAEAKAKWHEKFDGDMLRENIPVERTT